MAPGVSDQLILWAEDDENDALLFQRAFRKVQSPCLVIRVRDGREAVAYLRGDGDYSDRRKFPLPQLLVLDVKMPGKNGFEVLEWKRSQPDFSHLPTVMLSSSEAECDKLRADRLGATTYVGKPSKPEDMTALVKHLTAVAQQASRSGQDAGAEAR